MKECTNDYFEEDIPEASTRKKLKRELEQEALSRLEDSARTEEDFENVVTWWNRLDAIYDCPFEMYELVTDEDISRVIFELRDVQKELLYQLAIKGYPCQLIAAFRMQTDRNIRKIRDTMLKKLRKSFMRALKNRMDNHISLTIPFDLAGQA